MDLIFLLAITFIVAMVSPDGMLDRPELFFSSNKKTTEGEREEKIGETVPKREPRREPKIQYTRDSLDEEISKIDNEGQYIDLESEALSMNNMRSNYCRDHEEDRYGRGRDIDEIYDSRRDREDIIRDPMSSLSSLNSFRDVRNSRRRIIEESLPTNDSLADSLIYELNSNNMDLPDISMNPHENRVTLNHSLEQVLAGKNDVMGGTL